MIVVVLTSSTNRRKSYTYKKEVPWPPKEKDGYYYAVFSCIHWQLSTPDFRRILVIYDHFAWFRGKSLGGVGFIATNGLSVAGFWCTDGGDINLTSKLNFVLMLSLMDTTQMTWFSLIPHHIHSKNNIITRLVSALMKGKSLLKWHKIYDIFRLHQPGLQTRHLLIHFY